MSEDRLAEVPGERGHGGGCGGGGGAGETEQLVAALLPSTQAATVFLDGVTLHLREAIKFSG